MNKPSVSAGVVAGVALGAAALGAAAVAVRAACLQVARTRNGLARVKRVHDEGGDEVRVLVQSGVYQSASYVGERWAEFGGEENYLLIASDGDYAFAEAVPFDADFLGAALHDQHWE